MKSLLLMIEPDIPAGALIIRRSWRRSTPEWLIWAPCATRAPGSPQAQSRRSGVPQETCRITLRSRCGWPPFDPYPVLVLETGCEGGFRGSGRSVGSSGRTRIPWRSPASGVDLRGEVSGTRQGSDQQQPGGPAPRRRCGRPRSRSYSCGTDLTPAQATADGGVSARHDGVAVSRGGQGGRR